MAKSVEVQERREQILRAAVRVFSERGYGAATISDIASAAGLAHGTVYLYFRNKAAIFETLVSWFLQTLIDSITDPPSEATPGAKNPGISERSSELSLELYQMFHRALSACAAHPGMAEVSLQMTDRGGTEVAATVKRFRANLTTRLSRRLRAASEAGAIRPVDPDEAAHIVVHLLGMAIECLLAQGDRADCEQLAHQTVDFILFGLAAQTDCNNPNLGAVPLMDSSLAESPSEGPGRSTIESSCPRVSACYLVTMDETNEEEKAT